MTNPSLWFLDQRNNFEKAAMFEGASRRTRAGLSRGIVQPSEPFSSLA